MVKIHFINEEIKTSPERNDLARPPKLKTVLGFSKTNKI